MKEKARTASATAARSRAAAEACCHLPLSTALKVIFKDNVVVALLHDAAQAVVLGEKGHEFA